MRFSDDAFTFITRLTLRYMPILLERRYVQQTLTHSRARMHGGERRSRRARKEQFVAFTSREK